MNLRRENLKKVSKRIFDVVVSSLAIVIFSPLFAFIAVLIKAGSKRAAIFKQERAGREGKPFVFYKFRTMRHDVDPFGKSPSSGDDPRLTKVGKFLREYSLDELPQLFNVLKGNMSIVGPRPLYVAQISQLSEYHKRRILTKPGLTGLSQVYGRSSLTEEANLDLEVDYVEKQSFWLDIKIIFLTIGVVLRKKGVYES